MRWKGFMAQDIQLGNCRLASWTAAIVRLSLLTHVESTFPMAVIMPSIVSTPPPIANAGFTSWFQLSLALQSCWKHLTGNCGRIKIRPKVSPKKPVMPFAHKRRPDPFLRFRAVQLRLTSTIWFVTSMMPSAVSTPADLVQWKSSSNLLGSSSLAMSWSIMCTKPDILTRISLAALEVAVALLCTAETVSDFWTSPSASAGEASAVAAAAPRRVMRIERAIAAFGPARLKLSIENQVAQEQPP
mmetsp:Transcript_35562/g.80828  ORF Transcript_35562/g.80828 Transcript_35562/m.80828 type:complete len:243 (+) Transcript_35562:423-1151(+)